MYLAIIHDLHPLYTTRCTMLCNLVAQVKGKRKITNVFTQSCKFAQKKIYIQVLRYALTKAGLSATYSKVGFYRFQCIRGMCS